MIYLKEFSYLEGLDSFNSFLSKYKKRGYISSTDRKKMKGQDMRIDIFERLENDVNNCIELLSKIHIEDFDDFLIGMEDDSSTIIKKYSILFSLIVNTREMSDRFFDNLEEFSVILSLDANGSPANKWNEHKSLNINTVDIVNRIVQSVSSGRESKISKYSEPNKGGKRDDYNNLMLNRIKGANQFDFIRLYPQINLNIDYYFPKDVDNSENWKKRNSIFNHFKEYLDVNVISRLFQVEGIKNTYEITKSENYGFGPDDDTMEFKVKINL